MASTAALICRSCGDQRLETILALGESPLANALIPESKLAGPEPTFPLEIAFCPTCALVQLTKTIPPEVLYREYLYFSSFS